MEHFTYFRVEYKWEERIPLKKEYFTDEYIEMFETSGLKLIGSYSEHFTPYDENKMRMILIAEKKFSVSYNYSIS